VSQIHDVSFLVATAKLTKTTRKWYEMSDGPIIESWSGFQDAIIRRFKKRILFHVAMQKKLKLVYEISQRNLSMNTPWINLR